MKARTSRIPRRTPLKRGAAPKRNAANKGKRTPARRKERIGLSKQADALWSRLVKLPGRCVACGSTERLQAAHGFSRRYRGTRWLPINGFCLCVRHHMFWTHRPLEWGEYLLQAWGAPAHEELLRLALRPAKPDFPAIIAALTAEIEARS